MSKILNPRKISYKITDKEVDNLSCIEVLDENYKGVVFHFGRVSMTEDGEVNFEYTIDEGSSFLETDDKFKEVAASILYDIVVGKIDEN